MQTHFTVTARGGRMLELPVEADALNIPEGTRMEIILETEDLQPRKHVSAFGKYKGLASVDDFLKNKQAEIDLEDGVRE